MTFSFQNFQPNRLHNSTFMPQFLQDESLRLPENQKNIFKSALNEATEKGLEIPTAQTIMR